MSSPSLRMMRLLSLLQTHRYWPGAELADRLEVSLRTLRRDVDRLRELGYPVEAQRGVDGGYQLAPGASLPPLVLDDDEAVALALGLQAAAQAPVAGLADASVGALAKVAQVMPAAAAPPGGGAARRDRDLTLDRRGGQRRRRRPHHRGPGLPRRRPAALRLRGGRRRADGAGGRTAAARAAATPVVPGRLRPRPQRLAQLPAGPDGAAPTATGVRFRPRELPAPDAATFVRERLRNLPVTHTIEVVVQAPADDVRRVIGTWTTVEPEGPGRCRVTMTGDTLSWPTLGLLMIEAEFTVVGPPEMAEYLRTVAGRFSRAAASSPGPA